MDALTRASNSRLIPANLTKRLESALEDVNRNLATAQDGLRCVKQDNLYDRLVYTLWTGRGSKRQLEENLKTLEECCGRLKGLCLQLNSIGTCTVQSSHLLTSDVFKLHHEDTEHRPGKRLEDSDIVVAAASLVRNGQRIHTEVILEQKTRENDLRFLCDKLFEPRGGCSVGILPVLGYRQPPFNGPRGQTVFELVFAVPDGTVRQSLAHRIVSSPKPEIVERLKTCLVLAEAVVSVHTLGLVHKSIRPRSTLIVSKATGYSSANPMYLLDWSRIRELLGASTMLGENDWQKRIYQHPERQGRYVEQVYHPRHDIYSLGVCLLEILLWTPFVIETLEAHGQTSPQICQLFETRGLALGKQGLDDMHGGLPAKYKGDSSRLASKAWATCAIWKDIARTTLQDDELAALVLGCLNGDLGTAAAVSTEIEALMEARNGSR
jgi:hypothetical protein